MLISNPDWRPGKLLYNDVEKGCTIADPVGQQATPILENKNIPYLMTKALRENKTKITFWKMWWQTTLGNEVSQT